MVILTDQSKPNRILEPHQREDGKPHPQRGLCVQRQPEKSVPKHVSSAAEISQIPQMVPFDST